MPLEASLRPRAPPHALTIRTSAGSRSSICTVMAYDTWHSVDDLHDLHHI